ncbi:hypothetical protein PviCFBP13515_14570 [Pseudomonas viridiflava]|nr:hypothetical protein PviCFBP13507_15150 [Pseudomonas viridiflava]TKK26610.1 hypothetical protein PviCFBP13515_14570 [Pseudomonas viridiflava]
MRSIHKALSRPNCRTKQKYQYATALSDPPSLKARRATLAALTDRSSAPVIFYCPTQSMVCPPCRSTLECVDAR